MSDISVNWTALQSHADAIGSQGIHLYLKLVSLAPRDNPREVKISLRALAEALGWSVKKVKTYAALLQAAGIVRVYAIKDAYNRLEPSVYQLLI